MKRKRQEDREQGKPLYHPLCFRCEHRARFLEDYHAPRYECKQVNEGKIGCYMYKPVAPVLLRDEDTEDPRPACGGIFSRRLYGASVAEGEVVFDATQPGHLVYFVPNKVGEKE